MLKLLWLSPCSLFDSSSGAAVHAKIILEQIKKALGDQVKIKVLSSFVFDNERGAEALLNKAKEVPNNDISYFEENGIEYYYATNSASSYLLQKQDDDKYFYARYQEIRSNFKPDIIIGYGLSDVCICIYAKARDEGIKTVYLLCNGNHKGYTFRLFDHVWVEAQATSDYYCLNFAVNAIKTGCFIYKDKILASYREPKYITLINPNPQKGLSYFVKLALVYQRLHPKRRFLVVNSRGDFRDIVKKLKVVDKKGRITKPYKASNFFNVDIAEHTTNIAEVYAITRVLVVPSLWYEAWGRVAAEGIMNGIPVLASKSGGLVESVNGGGINLETSVKCQNDYELMPTDEDIKPWVKALDELYENSDKLKDKCLEAAMAHDINKSTQRVIDYMQILVDKQL